MQNLRAITRDFLGLINSFFVWCSCFVIFLSYVICNCSDWVQCEISVGIIDFFVGIICANSKVICDNALQRVTQIAVFVYLSKNMSISFSTKYLMSDRVVKYPILVAHHFLEVEQVPQDFIILLIFLLTYSLHLLFAIWKSINNKKKPIITSIAII